jgi:RNA polymerase sigma factor (sigma-70 family)
MIWPFSLGVVGRAEKRVSARRQVHAMKTTARELPRVESAGTDGLPHVFHPSFEGPEAEPEYGGPPPEQPESSGYLCDDATRDCARRMHYAAWRASRARGPREAAHWRQRYYDCRDRVVLGNLKLAFRAVHKWGAAVQLTDDLTGECQLVLINAVAAFNPWLGIRFSTYAFTCLIRALSRLSQRHTADRLARALSLESLPGHEPCYASPDERGKPDGLLLDEYFREEHTLLTPREKKVLRWRYDLGEGQPGTGTLEQVGRQLGLSKERVRQVQRTALGKLRVALAEAPPS